MRRVLAATLVVVALAAGWTVLSGAGGSSGGTFRVDALFDNAGFLIPGQDVKVAGAKAGKVVDVVVDGRRARVQMEVDDDFAPFRSDADCTIQPQSLIGEKFVQCAPGSPRGRPLAGRGDTVPTVPVTNTHAPVDPDLLAATFRQPVTTRVAIVLNELGTGLAARGDDLNAVIRRANPALQEADRVLRIVERDRARIRALTHEADRVVGALAEHRGAVGDVLERGARVADVTARRRAQLERTVAGLPPLLREAEPTMRDLASAARDVEPVLADAQQAAPALRRLARAAGPLADEARPALDRLGTASVTGERALRAAAPVVRRLRRFAAAARPTADLLDELLVSLRARGVVEGLQTFARNAALTTSRFDRYSHTIPAHLIGSACALYATTTVPACDAHFAAGRGVRATARPRRGTARAERERPRRPVTPAPVPPASTTPAPARTEPAPAPTSPAAPEAPKGAIPQLLDDTRELLDGLLGGGRDRPRQSPPSSDPVGPLLDLLLG
ncbi:MlaD family protein [Conexibacter sp. SYSU D00693]|uniref:MlaD family protein n=1 Tax=Conexibacter sp. SYSU D00693 TaxID=2812560 RepID=UPI00196B76EE|nr:MlaD family protein [Conexibacter sp. SYSU D00693]